MKKIQISVLLSVLGFVSYGQFDNTSYIIGGTANYSFDDYFNKSSSFSLAPSVGRPLKNQALVGVEFGFGVNHSKYDQNNVSSEHIGISYRPGVFYQKFYTITDQVYLNWRARGSVGFFKSVTEDDISKTTEHAVSYGLFATPGISWKVLDKVLLNASIGGVSFVVTDGEETTTSTFGVSFNNPQFGFSFLLN
ncbi:MAG: hypothetical protein RIB71_23895 [Imperialibacter sp.]|uniref:hypothetical protein n=1 Tax=Imperialibacter sp. TaxID=2038411 RepID=UPI0032EC3D71